jgi:AcrR family transcriptional regulator
MPREYRQDQRRAAADETRRRIISAARRLLPSGSELSVGRIAREAGVAVQTIYSHFGSKGNLLMAAVDDVQREVGLYAGFDRVWASRDGETALRRMIEATFELWHRAWPFVEFTVRARRIDPEVGEQLRYIDTMRHEHLVLICRRLELEARLRDGRKPELAADIAFALTTPTVYEELVQVRAWDLSSATATAIEAVVAATIATDAPMITTPPPDWAGSGPIPLQRTPQLAQE